MCGIVGLFLKNSALEPELGAMTADMLATMCERGPDSAGFAVYGAPRAGKAKLTLQSPRPGEDFPALSSALERLFSRPAAIIEKSNHAVLTIPACDMDRVVAKIRAGFPSIRIMGAGEAIEIYKDIGQPSDVAARFGLSQMRGTHAIGHTRMATESAVTTLGAHPFSTGPDQCLVHNGSLSNHNNLRRELVRQGFAFETENDSEVAAAYLSSRMAGGADLGQALQDGLSDLDGFFTFVVGTKTGFGVLRDPIACKPAVMAETEDYVAFGSEYRALSNLPGVDTARVWEPDPATVYFWTR